jgi:hypothetical protein
MEVSVAILVGLLMVCAVWAVAASVLIAKDLEKRGIPVSFFWLRLMILRYVYQYRKIIQAETGRVGPLFYHYVVPLNVAVVLVIVLAIVAQS